MNFKRLLKPLLIILAILILTLSVSAGDLFSTYDQRIKVTIDHTEIDADLSWFPVTVFLTSSQMEEVFTEFDADEDFDRIAFTSSDGETQLYADCELFDYSKQKAIYHVSKTGWTVSSSADTDIYLYYDNTAGHNTTYISKSGGTAAQSVWDSNFKAVYHMNDPEPTYDTEYDGSVEPDSDGWTLDGSDYASVSSGILTIDTSANDNYTCYYYKSPDVDFDAGFYLKLRMQLDSTMGSGDYIQIRIRDGTQDEEVGVNWYHNYGSNQTIRLIGSTVTDYTTNTSDDYHIYEIYVKGTSFSVYKDGSILGTKTVKSGTYDDWVMFGEATSGYAGKCYIDYLNYALDIGYNPAVGIVDATSNHNHGSKKATNEPIEATGKVGQGQDFDGSDDYIGFNGINIPNDSNFTFETILYPDAWVGDNPGVWRSGSDNQGTTFIIFQSDTGYPWIRINGTNVLKPSSGTSVSLDAWSNLSWVVVSESSATLYINGSSAQTDTHSIATASFDIYKLGYQYDVGQRIEGIYDEVRLSNTNRSAAWISATKTTLWDTLLTYGSEETAPTGEVTNVLFIFSNF